MGEIRTVAIIFGALCVLLAPEFRAKKLIEVGSSTTVTYCAMRISEQCERPGTSNWCKLLSDNLIDVVLEDLSLMAPHSCDSWHQTILWLRRIQGVSDILEVA